MQVYENFHYELTVQKYEIDVRLASLKHLVAQVERFCLPRFFSETKTGRNLDRGIRLFPMDESMVQQKCYPTEYMITQRPELRGAEF